MAEAHNPPDVAVRHVDGLTDDDVRRILKSVKTIALVGASANPSRPSYFVLKYLIAKGFEVWPVNPGLAGGDLLGRSVVASLADLPVPVDMVDAFRGASHIPGLMDDAIAIKAKVFWMQLGIEHEEAAAKGRDAGLDVVMNRCPKIEYARLAGEIGWMGIASRTISSSRPKLGSGKQSRQL